MTVTHDELRGWITALSDGKKIAQADQLRLAVSYLNLRAEAYHLKELLSEHLWAKIEREEELNAGRCE